MDLYVSCQSINFSLWTSIIYLPHVSNVGTSWVNEQSCINQKKFLFYTPVFYSWSSHYCLKFWAMDSQHLVVHLFLDPYLKISKIDETFSLSYVSIYLIVVSCSSLLVKHVNSFSENSYVDLEYCTLGSWILDHVFTYL